jgi:hypothetical protein
MSPDSGSLNWNFITVAGQSQKADPCANCDKYYSQIFYLDPSDFDKLILATLLKGNICVLNSIICHQRYQANAE